AAFRTSSSDQSLTLLASPNTSAPASMAPEISVGVAGARLASLAPMAVFIDLNMASDSSERSMQRTVHRNLVRPSPRSSKLKVSIQGTGEIGLGGSGVSRDVKYSYGRQSR